MILRCHAQAIICDGRIYRNSIIAFDEDSHTTISISPFEIETAFTKTFNGIIVVAPKPFCLPALPALTVANFSEILEKLAEFVPPVGAEKAVLLTIPL